MPRIITVLPGITRFQSGAGDLDDVLVKVREDAGGGWFPVVHVGNYFIGTEERYLFASKGSTTFSVSVTSGSPVATGSITVSGLAHDPTKLGPVLLSFSECPRPLRRVCSPLRAFRPITPTATGDLWSFVVPGSGVLVSLVSDPVTGVMISVPSTGDLRSTEDYYYDIKQGKVFLRGSSFPSLYVTYLVNEQDPELIKQEEILVVDRDNIIRTQYRNVLMNPVAPLIRRPTATGMISVYAIAASGNEVTPPTTGNTVGSGDVIAIEYYVQNSYTAVPIDDRGLKVDYCLSLSGSHVLEYETSDIPWFDSSLLPSGDTNYIQLNPLLIQRESGFLYLVDPGTSYGTPSFIQIDMMNRTPLRSAAQWEVAGIAVTVLDSEGQAIPQQRVVSTVVSGAGSLIVAFPSDQLTNGRGQVVYAWSPSATGLVTINFQVSGTTVSGQVNFFERDVGFYNQQSELQLGKLLLNIEETPFQNGLFRMSAYYCYADGAPYQAPDRVDPTAYSVTFVCQRSQFYNYTTGQPVPKTYVTYTDEDSIATVLVKPVPGDIIRAFVQTPVSGRIRNAAPVVIPEEGS